MSQLQSLLEKPVSELSDDELENRIIQLKKLRLTGGGSGKTRTAKSKGVSKKSKSNQDRRLENLVSKLDPEDLKKLLSKI